MKTIKFFWIKMLLVVCFPLFAFYYAQTNKEIENVKDIIKVSYFNGAFNKLDTEAMAKGFHTDFAIFTTKGEVLEKFPIKDWINKIETDKAKPDFDAKTRQYDCKFVQVDVTENAAIAKIEISKDAKLVFTDYLSLYKFESGWKIVGKIYHRHSK